MSAHPRASAALMADPHQLVLMLRCIYLARRSWADAYQVARECAEGVAQLLGTELDPQGIGKAAAWRDKRLEDLDAQEAAIRQRAKVAGIRLPTKAQLQRRLENPTTYTTHAPELPLPGRRRG